jgi:hypothetical protein
VDAMDNVDKLKCQLIDAYSHMLQKIQIGYPMEKYCTIREAMQAINYIENFALPQYEVNTIVDKYSLLITKL